MAKLFVKRSPVRRCASSHAVKSVEQQSVLMLHKSPDPMFRQCSMVINALHGDPAEHRIITGSRLGAGGVAAPLKAPHSRTASRSRAFRPP